MTEESTTAGALSAATRIVGALPRIASAVVGITAIAYVLGWRAAEAYFSDLGARWAVDLMTIQQLTRNGSLMVFTVAFFSTSLIASLIAGRTTQKKLGLWVAIWGLSGFVAWGLGEYVVPLFAPHWKYTALALAAVLLLISVAVSIAELTALLSTGRPFDSYWPYVHEALIIVGIFWVPSFVGQADAERDRGFDSRLPVVTLTVHDDHHWRLVKPVGDLLLLIDPNDRESLRQFKLVDPTAVASLSPGDDDKSELRSRTPVMEPGDVGNGHGEGR